MTHAHRIRIVIAALVSLVVLAAAGCSEQDADTDQQANAAKADPTGKVVDQSEATAHDADATDRRDSPGSGDAASGVDSGVESGVESGSANGDTSPDPHPIKVEPAELDMGKVQLNTQGEGVVTLTNVSKEPVIFESAKSSCGCTAVNAPRNTTMRPGDSIDVKVTMRIGGQPGQKLNKSVTWRFKKHPPIKTPVRSEAHSFVSYEPTTLNPKVDPEGRLTLRSSDGQPFRITGVEPAVVSGIPDEAATEFSLTVSFAELENLLADGFVIFTDHPKCERIEPVLDGINWVLPPGVARSNDPNRKLLEWAAQGRAAGIAAELDAGADIEWVDVRRTPALHFAVRSGYPEAVSLLIERGANIEAVNEDEATALIVAALANDLEMISLLLDAGASIEAVDRKGRTAVMLAAEGGDAETVGFLLERGAAINTRDRTQGTALTLASAFGNLETVRVLLDAGADVDAADFLGYQALHWAALKGDSPRIGALLEAGAAIDAPSSREQLTPLMCAARSGSLEALTRLLEASPDLNAVDKSGRSALLWAIRQGTPEKVAALLEAGASRDVQDSQGAGIEAYAAQRAGAEGDQIRALLEQAP